MIPYQRGWDVHEEEFLGQSCPVTNKAKARRLELEVTPDGERHRQNYNVFSRLKNTI